MHVREFDFDLPTELIAQTPPSSREESRLMLLSQTTGGVAHSRISSLPEYLRDGDVLVANNTRVFPARLIGVRVPSGGGVECLLVGQVESDRGAGSEIWEALVHPGQKLKPGARMLFAGSPAIHGEVLERRFFGRRLVRLWTADNSPLDLAVDAIGHVPLPPYIRRQDTEMDRERYQTVFAERRGSVAAPTAGLHLTERIMAALRARGVEVVFITLHVGYGTFQPVRVEEVEEHQMEPERYEIAPRAAEAIGRAISKGGRIVAVGTTTTRTLEASALAHGGTVVAGQGVTDLFIRPGFRFQVVQGLLTNFHLPQSSLLMLVSAFAGRERVLECYRQAIAERYRFYSYGDAMLII